MKKDVLFPLLTCVGLGLCANSLILSLPLSVISKGTCLILSSFVFSSVALMVLALALRGTWSTTKRPDSLNRLATLAEKEREILAGKATKKMTTSHDEWCSCEHCCPTLEAFRARMYRDFNHK
ncbi:hypothetical protein HOR49_gp17 [Klebsiella phage K5-2]|uniref:Uncharacterized protein n=1 Tax=Klebsiella phage K5-2 TaxID=1932361 RepID=A0A219YH98_BPK52|nr:hypothetical protein HOR49_gp17 [Klebsiella phage K5-2]APZ82784.1 hypothetical protein k52_017 [Klebsiella phage K5-2]